MTADIRNIDGSSANQIVTEVVDLLEEALALARRGEIIAVAIATVDAGRHISNSYTTAGYWAHLAASISALQHEIFQRSYERSPHD